MKLSKGWSVLAAVLLSGGLLVSTTSPAVPPDRSVSVAYVTPDAGEHGGPGPCGPANDGAMWYDEFVGQWFQCRRVNGKWGWYLAYGQCNAVPAAVKPSAC